MNVEVASGAPAAAGSASSLPLQNAFSGQRFHRDRVLQSFCSVYLFRSLVRFSLFVSVGQSTGSWYWTIPSILLAGSNKVQVT